VINLSWISLKARIQPWILSRVSDIILLGIYRVLLMFLEVDDNILRHLTIAKRKLIFGFTKIMLAIFVFESRVIAGTRMAPVTNDYPNPR
jgi:succinate dehydrogenase hydrophobic anchor subunit